MIEHNPSKYSNLSTTVRGTTLVMLALILLQLNSRVQGSSPCLTGSTGTSIGYRRTYGICLSSTSLSRLCRNKYNHNHFHNKSNMISYNNLVLALRGGSSSSYSRDNYDYDNYNYNKQDRNYDDNFNDDDDENDPYYSSQQPPNNRERDTGDFYYGDDYTSSSASTSKRRKSQNKQTISSFSSSLTQNLQIIQTGNKKIGLTLLAAGAVFTMLGISLFFNKSLMRLGNLLFIAGVPITIGPGRTTGYFLQPRKARATGCLGFGIFLVMVGWPILGIALEVFGLLNLFGNMFPVLMILVKQMPFVGQLFNSSGSSSSASKDKKKDRERGGRSYYDDYEDDDSYYQGAGKDRDYRDDYYDDRRGNNRRDYDDRY